MNEANVRETKDRILNVAERLFAQQGIEATSLRQITSQAQVNLAAVNYHFNSKDELVHNVYVRRLRPITEKRLARLTELEKNEATTLDAVLDAFFEPAIEAATAIEKEGLTIGQLLGRLYSEPHGAARNIIATEMAESASRFGAALSKVLPHLSRTELLWRFHLTVGVLAHTLAASSIIQKLSQGRIDPTDKKEVLRQMNAYAKAGLTAPSMEAHS